MTVPAGHPAKLETFARLLFFAALATLTILFIVPMQDVPVPMADTLSDKAHHAIAFALLMLLGGFAFPSQRPLRLALLLLAYGAVMEVVQGMSNLGRHASWADLAADGIGICIALVVLKIGGRLRRSANNEKHLQ